MTKKFLRKLMIIFIGIIIISNIITCYSYAADFSLSSCLKNGKISNNNTEISMSAIKDAQGTIYNILFYGGILVSLVIVTVLGFQFLMSSPEEKAEIKERMIPFVIGAVVVFAGLTIWKIAVTLAQNAAF